jgi:hypothetical protein
MKKIAIGFIIALVVGAAAIAIFREPLAKMLATRYIAHVAQQKLDILAFPEEEQTAIMASVGVLNERISMSDFKLEEVQTLLQDPVIAPAFGAVLLRGFEHKYLPQANYDEATLAAGATTISRFQDATLRRLISDGTYQALAERVLSDRESLEFKERLTRDEIDACLRLMGEAADHAGIPDQRITVDPIAELRRAVDRATEARQPQAPATPSESL